MRAHQRGSNSNLDVYAEITQLFTSDPDLIPGLSVLLPDTPVPVKQEEIETLDALLFCDVKAGGIQIAAQAGYPVITIPIGLDPDGMPVPLTLQHTAWREDKLIKWASSIEDLMNHYNQE